MLPVFYRRLEKAIRAIGSSHILFLDGNKYSSDFSVFDPADPLPNCVYTTHDYALPGIAGDATEYPGTVRGEYFDRAVVEQIFLRPSSIRSRALDEDPRPWRRAHERSVAALFAHCFDETDGLFYDRDRTGAFVRVQSDVLLPVLACEIGDRAFFEASLRNYLLNTRKFFARYPFTSIALDDPRFSQDFSRNSWAGPSNFLSLLRAPHAFEHHGHHVELTWAASPVLAAVCRITASRRC